MNSKEENMEMLNISLYQFSTLWLDYKENIAAIEKNCQELPQKTDLLLLPEMFNTAYVLDTKWLDVSMQDYTINKLTEISSASDVIIGGSIPYYRSGNWYNTFIFVDKSGLVASYDKIQLFAPAGEKVYYNSGKGISYYDLSNWKIQPLICYDLRFPYLSFSLQSPDVLIYSANWPVTRIHHWKSLLIARAIENQCYVVGINRTGQDENGFIYPGATMVVDFNGQIITELDDKPQFTSLSLDKSAMFNFRKKLPFSDDRIGEWV